MEVLNAKTKHVSDASHTSFNHLNACMQSNETGKWKVIWQKQLIFRAFKYFLLKHLFVTCEKFQHWTKVLHIFSLIKDLHLQLGCDQKITKGDVKNVNGLSKGQRNLHDNSTYLICISSNVLLLLIVIRRVQYSVYFVQTMFSCLLLHLPCHLFYHSTLQRHLCWTSHCRVPV